jgi:hypothetical protein
MSMPPSYQFHDRTSDSATRSTEQRPQTRAQYVGRFPPADGTDVPRGVDEVDQSGNVRPISGLTLSEIACRSLPRYDIMRRLAR